MKNKFVFILFAALAILLPLTFHPSLVNMFNEEQSRGVLTPFILIVFALLYITTYSSSSFKNKFVKKYTILYFIMLVLAVGLSLTGSSEMLGYECRALLITLIAVLIGLQVQLSRKQLVDILLIYCVFTSFVGLLQIFVNGSGFVIDQYFAFQKNALGVLVGSSTVIALGLGLDKNGSKTIRLIGIGLMVLLFVILLTIRARAALFSSVFVVVLMFYLSVDGKGFFRAFIITALAVLALVLLMPSTFGAYIHDSIFFGSASEDITSGRADRNAMALSFIKDNLFLGYMGDTQKIPTPHNFLLITWVKYGVIFSIPIILIYLTIIINVVKNCMKTRGISIYKIGYFVMIIPLIVSLAEYTLPFGPGTVTVVNFILMGVAMRYNCNTEISSNYEV